eukprot:gene9462-biopygen3126
MASDKPVALWGVNPDDYLLARPSCVAAVPHDRMGSEVIELRCVPPGPDGRVPIGESVFELGRVGDGRYLGTVDRRGTNPTDTHAQCEQIK